MYLVSALSGKMFIISLTSGSICQLVTNQGKIEWFFFFFWPHSVWDLSSPARDRTRVFYIGSMESQPLDGQGSPRSVFVVALVIKSSFYLKTYADIHIWFLLVLL